MRKSKLVILISAILCTSLILTSCNEIDLDFIKEEFSVSEECGEKIRARDFKVYDELNNEISYSDFKGKPTVVFLYGVKYYSVNREELNFFDKAYRKYKDKVNFMIVHLSCCYDETKEDAETVISGLSFPAYFDLDGSAEHVYSVSAYPRTIIIDAEGYIYHDETGNVNSSYLEKHIERVINGEPYVTDVPKRCGCRIF